MKARIKNGGWLGRIAAFSIGCLLAVQSAITAYAALVPEATIDTTKKGSLTLYKYDITQAQKDGVVGSFVATGRSNADAEALYEDYSIQGVEFTYLKVGEIDTLSTTNSSGAAEIKLVYGLDSKAVEALAVSQTDAVDNKDGLLWFISDTLIDALAESLANNEVATKNTLENYVLKTGGTTMPETNAAGRTSASELPLGLYLVVETAVPEDVVSTVNPFFVSLPMTDIDGDSWNYDVVAYPKNQTGDPDLTKEVAEVTSAKGATPAYGDTATASDGDVVAYRITSKLPKITSEATYLTAYTFVDKLDKGISYNKEDVTLTWYNTSNERVVVWTEDDVQQMFVVSYTSSAAGTEMTVMLTDAGLAAINPAYSEYTVVIDYKCTVNCNDTVVYGDKGNKNEVTLEWKRTNMDYSDTLTADCLVYTYGLELTKIFSDGKGDFSQVKFVVKNQTDNYYITANKAQDGVYYVTGTVGANEQAATVFTPNSAGKLVIYGLEDDTYIVTEVGTDDGYLLLKDNITIVITSTEGDHNRTGSATVNEKDVTMAEVAGSANALATLTVVNERIYGIPFTGDSYRFFLPVIGVAGAMLLLFLLARKKKCAEK